MKKLLRQIFKRLVAIVLALIVGLTAYFVAVHFGTGYDKITLRQDLNEQTQSIFKVQLFASNPECKRPGVSCCPNPTLLVILMNENGDTELRRFEYGRVVITKSTEEIVKILREIFHARERDEVYRELSTWEIEKTIIFNASKQARYGDVIKIIEAVKSAGAEPLLLDVDGDFDEVRIEKKAR